MDKVYIGTDYTYDNLYKDIFKLSNSSNKPKQKTVKDEINQIIYNPPATVIKWTDGDKTVVKATENDPYNPLFGVLMAYFQKNNGLTKTQVGKFCDKIVKDYETQEELKMKKSKKEFVDYDDWLPE